MNASLGQELSRADKKRLLDLAREMASARAVLSQHWEARLRTAHMVRDLPPSGALSEYVDSTGGFRIPANHVQKLAKRLTEALGINPLRRDADWLSLRGFSYYAVDEAFYLPGRAPTAAERWRVLERRWPVFQACGEALASEAAHLPLPWYNWLGWVSFLEAVQNDLSAFWWTSYVLGAPRRSVDDARTAVAGLLAEVGWHLWNSPERVAAGTWAGRLMGVLDNQSLSREIRDIGVALRARDTPGWAVRAMREGDVFWQVAAAFEAKWEAIRAQYPDGPVLLVSEAFGALAVGPLWFGLMPTEDRQRTRLETSRMSVHESEMGRVPQLGFKAEPFAVHDHIVVHLDDSVFTGRTHQNLRQALRGTPAAIRLVTLTFDIGTPFNHPEEITCLGTSVGEHLDQIERLVRASDGSLPPAASFWARRKGSDVSDPDPDRAAVRRVLRGSDRLLATLWHRYMEEISNA